MNVAERTSFAVISPSAEVKTIAAAPAVLDLRNQCLLARIDPILVDRKKGTNLNFSQIINYLSNVLLYY